VAVLYGFATHVPRSNFVRQRLEKSNVYQSTWLHEEPIDDNEPIGASYVLNSIEDGYQADSVHTVFSKAMDRVRH
jgi:hypothetical protein